MSRIMLRSNTEAKPIPEGRSGEGRIFPYVTRDCVPVGVLEERATADSSYVDPAPPGMVCFETTTFCYFAIDIDGEAVSLGRHVYPWSLLHERLKGLPRVDLEHLCRSRMCLNDLDIMTSHGLEWLDGRGVGEAEAGAEKAQDERG